MVSLPTCAPSQNKEVDIIKYAFSYLRISFSKGLWIDVRHVKSQTLSCLTHHQPAALNGHDHEGPSRHLFWSAAGMYVWEILLSLRPLTIMVDTKIVPRLPQELCQEESTEFPHSIPVHTSMVNAAPSTTEPTGNEIVSGILSFSVFLIFRITWREYQFSILVPLSTA